MSALRPAMHWKSVVSAACSAAAFLAPASMRAWTSAAATADMDVAMMVAEAVAGVMTEVVAEAGAAGVVVTPASGCGVRAEAAAAEVATACSGGGGRAGEGGFATTRPSVPHAVRLSVIAQRGDGRALESTYAARRRTDIAGLPNVAMIPLNVAPKFLLQHELVSVLERLTLLAEEM